MIKLSHLTPNYYNAESRDFQLIGRLYDLIFNDAKLNVDLMRNKHRDPKMLDLLTRTVGFESKHIYNTDDLMILCNSFKTIIRKKGTRVSIEEAIKVLLRAQNIQSTSYVYIDEEACEVTLYVPEELTGIILLNDILDYILPVGFTYNIIPANLFIQTASTEYQTHSTITFQQFKPQKLGHVFIPNDDGKTGKGGQPIRMTLDKTESGWVRGAGFATGKETGVGLTYENLLVPDKDTSEGPEVKEESGRIYEE